MVQYEHFTVFLTFSMKLMFLSPFFTEIGFCSKIAIDWFTFILIFNEKYLTLIVVDL